MTSLPATTANVKPARRGDGAAAASLRAGGACLAPAASPRRCRLLGPFLPGEAHAPTRAGLVAAAVGTRARTGRGPADFPQRGRRGGWTGGASNRELGPLERPNSARGRYPPGLARRCPPRRGAAVSRPAPAEVPAPLCGEKRDSTRRRGGGERGGRAAPRDAGRREDSRGPRRRGLRGALPSAGAALGVRDWPCRWSRQRSSCLESGLAETPR